MRKRIRGRKFGRPAAQRNALLNGLAQSLFEHGRIKTTETRAKEVRRVAERAITTGKKGTIASRRALEKSFTPTVVKRIVDDIAPKYQDRPGGYTRIIKTGRRVGDQAKTALIELVESADKAKS